MIFTKPNVRSVIQYNIDFLDVQTFVRKRLDGNKHSVYDKKRTYILKKGAFLKMKPFSIKMDSYSILYMIFFVLLITCIAVVCHDLKGPNPNQYKTITAEKGDTLWALGEKYKGKMTTQEFVSWVEQNNNLANQDVIQTGQTLIVPILVSKNNTATEKVAYSTVKQGGR